MSRKLRKKMFISVVTAFLLVGFVATVVAAPQKEQEKMAVFEGELLSINLAAKTLTVKNSTDEEKSKGFPRRL